MKKKVALILSILMCLCLALTGCSGYSYTKIEKPDASYAVIGNGGISVQQGKYIYFVNGYSDITDTDGNTNVWGNVVKGGIYRVEMIGKDGKQPQTVTYTADMTKALTDGYEQDPYLGYFGGDYKTVAPAEVPGVQEDELTDYSGFVMREETDFEEQSYSVVDATCVVPKKVSNGGSEDGGIYIFEGWIYYSTPLSKKNKEGEVQYALTAFMRTRLDGSGTEVLYETTDASATIKYGYYRYGGKTYLTILEGSTLKSITCKDGGGKSTAYTLAEDVTSVLFSNKPVYYSGMNENGIEDFIYYTRSATSDDLIPNGAVMCRVRPNNTDGTVLMNNNRVFTLKALTNGYLYYYSLNVDNEGSIFASNLASYPLSPDDTTDRVMDEVEIMPFSNTFGNIFLSNTINSVDDQGVPTVSHYMIAVNNGSTNLYRMGEEPLVLTNESAYVFAVVNNKAYYYVDSRSSQSEDKTLETVISTVQLPNSLQEDYFPEILNKNKAVIGNFLKPDITAGYLFFADTTTEIRVAEDLNTGSARVESGYLHFKRVTDLENEPEWYIGMFNKDDLEDVEIIVEEEE